VDAEARAAVEWLERPLAEMCQETARRPLAHFDDMAAQFERVQYRGGEYSFHGQDLTVQPMFTLKNDHPEKMPGMPRCPKCEPNLPRSQITIGAMEMLADRVHDLIVDADD
jgi:hypothetical protein